MVVLASIILNDVKTVIIMHRKVGMHIIAEFILQFIAYAMLVQCSSNSPFTFRGLSTRDIALPLQEFVLKTNHVVAKVK